MEENENRFRIRIERLDGTAPDSGYDYDLVCRGYALIMDEGIGTGVQSEGMTPYTLAHALAGNGKMIRAAHIAVGIEAGENAAIRMEMKNMPWKIEDFVPKEDE